MLHDFIVLPRRLLRFIPLLLIEITFSRDSSDVRIKQTFHYLQIAVHFTKAVGFQTSQGIWVPAQLQSVIAISDVHFEDVSRVLHLRQIYLLIRPSALAYTL